ncbi:MAG: SxtJ family membrane protein [Proteobacteria bacterium]|nr:SxtJ family membrane protein [Pseudomonadota bacterium]
MKYPNDITTLDEAGLRQFALTTGGIIAILFGAFFPWLLQLKTPYWPWLLTTSLIIWGLIAPGSLDPLYRYWMRFGLLLNRITTPLILGIIFYFIFSPFGLIMRLFGQNVMTSGIDKTIDTYRTISRPRTKDSMEKPF